MYGQRRHSRITQDAELSVAASNQFDITDLCPTISSAQRRFEFT
jgi:hypothetical protein